MGCSNQHESTPENDTSMAFDSDSESFERDSNTPPSDDICALMNCDDGIPCTEDRCEDARCYNTPTAPCAESAPNTCIHWDDICGEGCHWTQDYDCAQWAWQIPLEMPAPEAYAAVIYIDPTSVETPDGSIERPFTAWSDVNFQEIADNTAVLQKRGTEVEVGWAGSVPTISFNADRILLGAYGDESLPRPILHITGDVGGKGDHLVFRDLEISRVAVKDGGSARAVQIHGHQNVIYNVHIHGDSEQNFFTYSCIHAGGSVGLKMLHSQASHCGEEVIMGGGPLIEVGNTQMEKVSYPDGGNGDGFQFGDDACLGMWFHDNDFDGRYINNKFFLISTCGATSVLIENNHIKMAQNRSATHVGGELVIMRRNLFEFIEDDPGATGLWLTGGNYELYHNVFYNYATAMNASGARKIFNNTFVGYTDVAINQGSESDVRNNIFAAAGSAWGLSGMTASHNLFFAESTVSPSAIDGASIVGDPLLTDPDHRNFSVAANSPAIGTGDPSVLDALTPLSIDGGIWRDYNGAPLNTESIDIGAVMHTTP